MRASVVTKFGPPEVFQLKDLEKPVPKDDEVLIRICATTVTAADCELRGLNVPFWARLPIRIWLGSRMPNLILGQELAGEVEAVGKAVKRFQPVTRFLELPVFVLALMQSTSACLKNPQRGCWQETGQYNL